MTSLSVIERPASLWRRLAALLYDWMLLAGVLMLTAFVAVAIHSWTQPTMTGGIALTPQPVSGLWFQLLLWLVAVLYFSLFWWRRGRTPGMSAWRIIVCDARSLHPPAYVRAWLRAVLAPCSALCLGCGYLWCLLPGKSGYWHDTWSATRILGMRVNRGHSKT